MKMLGVGLAAQLMAGGVAWAAAPLSDVQMDRIGGGAGVCLASVPTDGMTCLITTSGIPAANTAATGFMPTTPMTIISDLQKFFNIVPNSPADVSAEVFTVPLPPVGAP
jgi:hypothetical protein